MARDTETERELQSLVLEEPGTAVGCKPPLHLPPPRAPENTALFDSFSFTSFELS